MNRRRFIAMAASFSASLAWSSGCARRSRIAWKERRDLYPQGVASGDPHTDSVIVWTRRLPSANNMPVKLILEMAEDPAFDNVIATARNTVTAETDWTCRVLTAGLKPNRIYWYRFTDENGFGSRIGRTRTAPSLEDDRPVQFAFVSCQNVQLGASTAYRRMIWEDEHTAPDDQLSFVLHLGDFVYELVWYPEDRPKGYYARKIRDLVRYPNGEKIDDFHVPTTVGDYRAVYRAYLTDPDLQDARARWPFICMWDNHEFSWKGWQSQQNFGTRRPAQTRKVAANQAWFEYQPARVVKAGGLALDRYQPPPVTDQAIHDFDEHGLGLESGNLASINSLKLFRSLPWGRNIELILTDNRSFRSEPAGDQPEALAFELKEFPYVLSQDVIEVLDAGRSANGGHPPDTIRFNGRDLPNPRRQSPPQSMLGAEQKKWFLAKLRESNAPWKLWGNSVATLDWRIDFQNLPAEIQPQWPTSGYAQLNDQDWSGYRCERADILNFVRDEKIAGLVSLAGDRHAFSSGVLSAELPPKSFQPVAVEFVTGSISAPGLFESAEYNLPKNHPLRAVYLTDTGPEHPLGAAINFSILHGVRSSLALQKTGNEERALTERNPEVAPHLSFVDVGGHGYAIVRVRPDLLETEFVCVPRPIENNASSDGGALAYRLTQEVKAWGPGGVPSVQRLSVDGKLPVAFVDRAGRTSV